MRTLHVDAGCQMGGGQWQALYLMERLAETVLLAPAGSPLFQEASKRGVNVQPLTFSTLFSAARRADLVHVHEARAHTLAALAGGAPLVVARRVHFPVRRSMASRWKYGRAALYVAVSKFVASTLEASGVPQNLVRLVYDGVPIPLEPARPQPGRVVALAKKPVEIPGVKVHLTSNLWQDLSTASVFVYKSEAEPLGSAALAAMASGVPVVASGTGGLPEIVEHERTGLLVGNGDFAGAVRRLLDDPRLATELGRAGREHVKRGFSADQMTENTMRVYHEVIKC
jgi:glycosyl transferase family 1/glycosyl transferase family 4